MPARAHVKRCRGAASDPQRLWHKRRVNSTRYVRLVSTVLSNSSHDQRPWTRCVSALRLLNSTLERPYARLPSRGETSGGSCRRPAGWHMSLTSYTWRTFTVDAIVPASFGKPAEMRGRKASGPEVLTPRIAGLPARVALQSHLSVKRTLLIGLRASIFVLRDQRSGPGLSESRHGILRCRAVSG